MITIKKFLVKLWHSDFSEEWETFKFSKKTKRKVDGFLMVMGMAFTSLLSTAISGRSWIGILVFMYFLLYLLFGLGEGRFHK